MTQKRAANLLVECLINQGVDKIYGVPGESYLSVLDALYDFNNKINFISKIYPSDANFILIKVDDANKRYNQLISKGIVIRNRTNQHGCENCLRITVGTSKENKRLLKILKEL